MKKDIPENEIVQYEQGKQYNYENSLIPFKTTSYGRIQTESKYGDINPDRRPSHAIHHQFVS